MRRYRTLEWDGFVASGGAVADQDPPYDSVMREMVGRFSTLSEPTLLATGMIGFAYR